MMLMSNNTGHLNPSLWTVGNYNQQFLLLSDILWKKQLIMKVVVPPTVSVGCLGGAQKVIG